MKKTNNKAIVRGSRLFFGVFLVLGMSGFLSSCAYTETMNERNAEGQRLQKELDFETERGRRLSR